VKIRSLPVLPLEVQVNNGSSRFWRPTVLRIVHNGCILILEDDKKYPEFEKKTHCLKRLLLFAFIRENIPQAI